jgi:hypothetical protein
MLLVLLASATVPFKHYVFSVSISYLNQTSSGRLCSAYQLRFKSVLDLMGDQYTLAAKHFLGVTTNCCWQLTLPSRASICGVVASVSASQSGRPWFKSGWLRVFIHKLMLTGMIGRVKKTCLEGLGWGKNRGCRIESFAIWCKLDCRIVDSSRKLTPFNFAVIHFILRDMQEILWWLKTSKLE